MVREHNEDAALVDPKGTYFIVADGMGGHAAGEVASSMAVEQVKESLEQARPQIDRFAQHPTDDGRHELVKLLEAAVRRAHQAVFERGGKEADKKGMGTTLDVLLLADGEAFVAHVGDSRTYLLRSGAAAQVTTDHTVAEVLVIEGKLSPEEARVSPLRTILVNAIGVSPDVGVELAHIKLRRGDKILLCSDGLHDYFPAESEISELLAEKSGQEGLERLVEIAKQRGGHDNITGVLVEVIEGAPSLEEEEEEARENARVIEAEQRPEDREAVPSTVSLEPTLPLPDDGTGGTPGKASAEGGPGARDRGDGDAGDEVPGERPAGPQEAREEKKAVETRRKTGRKPKDRGGAEPPSGAGDRSAPPTEDE